MPRTPRRHIRNPAKPPVFRPPTNLDVHIVSATLDSPTTMTVTMSGPILSPTSSVNFLIASTISGYCAIGNSDAISGGPLISFTVDFGDDGATTNITNGDFWLIAHMNPDYAVDMGIKIRSPQAIFVDVP